jgi:hypothetical protein
MADLMPPLPPCRAMPPSPPLPMMRCYAIAFFPSSLPVAAAAERLSAHVLRVDERAYAASARVRAALTFARAARRRYADTAPAVQPPDFQRKFFFFFFFFFLPIRHDGCFAFTRYAMAFSATLY